MTAVRAVRCYVACYVSPTNIGCRRKSIGGTIPRWFHQKTVRWKEGAPSVVVERDLLCHHHSSIQQNEEQTPEHDNKKPWDAVRVDDTTRVITATRHIQSDKALIYVGDYHNARQLMSAIKRRVVPNIKYNNNKGDNASSSMTITEQWEAQRWINRERSRQMNFLLIQVDSNHELSSGIRRAPNTVVKPILNSAFGERDEPYLIPLREVLGMIGAHEWYKKGVFIPQIDNFIYPHYGVFAPTRREYLELIDNATVPSSANNRGLVMLEIGVGTGVISAMMLLHQKVKKVIGTDINPNAIACAKDNLARLGLSEQVELLQTSLFPVLEKDVKADLIVCNPPWLPGKADSWLDQAVYDESNMLRDFLLHAERYLTCGSTSSSNSIHNKSDGEVWLVISNMAELLGLRSREELLEMVDAGNLEIIDVQCTTPTHPKASRPLQDKKKKKKKKAKNH
eukprot:scaffold665172_cov59-Attheya_sp.AAC.1